ncbi:MAG: hypothetical protein H6739_35300 [Alphaproteobacteria bacterium]|nr:hypothetical protein [Alphaproteobacteria bacterium]
MAETPRAEQADQADQTSGLDAFDLAYGLRVDTLNMNLKALQELGSFPEEWRVTLRPGAALDVALGPPTVAVIERGRFPEEVGRVLFTLTLAEGTFTADGVEIPVEDWGLTFPLNLAYADLIAEMERAGREVPPYLRERLTRFPPERFSLKALLVDFTNAHLIVEGVQVRFGNARELTPEQMKVFKEALVKLLETLRSRPDGNLLGLTAQPRRVGDTAADPQRWLTPTGGAMTAHHEFYQGEVFPTLATLMVTQGAPVPVARDAPYAYGYACRVLGQRKDAQGSLLISQRALLGYLMEHLRGPLALEGVPAKWGGDGTSWSVTRPDGAKVRLTLKPDEGGATLQVRWRWEQYHLMTLPQTSLREEFDLEYTASGALEVRFTGPPRASGTSSHLTFRYTPGSAVCRVRQRRVGKWGELSTEFLEKIQDPKWVMEYLLEKLGGGGLLFLQVYMAFYAMMANLYKGYAAGYRELQRLDQLPPLLMQTTVMLPGAKDIMYRDLRFERTLTGPHLVMGLYASI